MDSEEFYRNRIRNFFLTYAPQRLSDIDSVLTVFEGQEDNAIELLISEYGKEPLTPGEKTYLERICVSNNWHEPPWDSVIGRLIVIYLEKSPSSIPSKIKSVLTKYAEKKHRVIPHVVSRLGEEPPRNIFLERLALLIYVNDPDSLLPSLRLACDVATQCWIRLMNFYTKYAPTKISEIEQTLNRWAHKQYRLFEELEKKYGPEVDYFEDFMEMLYRRRVVSMYALYAPEKFNEVPELLSSVDSSNQNLVITSLVTQYGKEPATGQYAPDPLVDYVCAMSDPEMREAPLPPAMEECLKTYRESVFGTSGLKRRERSQTTRIRKDIIQRNRSASLIDHTRGSLRRATFCNEQKDAGVEKTERGAVEFVLEHHTSAVRIPSLLKPDSSTIPSKQLFRSPRDENVDHHPTTHRQHSLTLLDRDGDLMRQQSGDSLYTPSMSVPSSSSNLTMSQHIKSGITLDRDSFRGGLILYPNNKGFDMPRIQMNDAGQNGETDESDSEHENQKPKSPRRVPLKAPSSLMDTSTRVRRIYMKYNPTKLEDIPLILAQFEGRERDLIERLIAKYGPEPTVFEPLTETERIRQIREEVPNYDVRKLHQCSPAIIHRYRNDALSASVTDTLKWQGAPNADGNKIEKLTLNTKFSSQDSDGRSDVDEGPYNECESEDDAPEYDLRDRLVQFYAHYQPAKILTIDDTLRVWKGHEESLIPVLEEMYGKLPIMRPFNSTRERIYRMYAHYDPSGLKKAEDELEKFKTIEDSLLRYLIRKFGPEPSFSENGSEKWNPSSPRRGKLNSRVESYKDPMCSFRFQRNNNKSSLPSLGSSPKSHTARVHGLAVHGIGSAWMTQREWYAREQAMQLCARVNRHISQDSECPLSPTALCSEL